MLSVVVDSDSEAWPSGQRPSFAAAPGPAHRLARWRPAPCSGARARARHCPASLRVLAACTRIMWRWRTGPRTESDSELSQKSHTAANRVVPILCARVCNICLSWNDFPICAISAMYAIFVKVLYTILQICLLKSIAHCTTV